MMLVQTVICVLLLLSSKNFLTCTIVAVDRDEAYAHPSLKQYEVTDHLGNVLATVSDARESDARKLINDPYTIVAYNPVLQSQSDYYPFGMLMPGRHMEDTITRTTNVSYTRVVPMHTLRHIVWPDGNAVLPFDSL